MLHKMHVTDTIFITSSKYDMMSSELGISATTHFLWLLCASVMHEVTSVIECEVLFSQSHVCDASIVLVVHGIA